MTLEPGPRSERTRLTERERLFDDSDLTAAPFLRALLVAALALSTALFLVALSARQLSRRDTALPLLEASVEALTDPEPLIAAHLDSMRDRARDDADDAIVVPAYPLEVALSPDEVQAMEPPQLADILVARSAALVYGQGMDAFDQSGAQDDSLFSAQGIVRRIADRLTAGAHDTASTLALVLLLVTAALAVAVVLVYRDDRRLRALGIGFLLGGAAVFLGSLLFGFIAERIGGSDAFVEDVRDIVGNVLEVSRRNGMITTGLGGVVIIASVVVRLVPDGAGDFGFMAADEELEYDE